jgi:tetratricopeptide (TPR) repeat protein
MTFKIRRKYFLVFFIPVLFITGCGVWEDFTTYFNLYYNTADAFDEAEKSIYNQKRELFSTEDLDIPAATTTQLTKVIEKASKILQFHKNSSFIDDALMMLGKSFYYQKNYQKALRKFQELITAQSGSSLSLETYLWIGKSEMKLKDYKNALATLDAVIDTAAMRKDEDILKGAYVEEIVYHLQNKNLVNAITLSKQLIGVISDKEVIAEVYYELGKLYLQTDDINNSVEALKKVNNYSPTYEVEVRANIELAKALRKSGKNEDALSILEHMGNKNKYTENYSEIDLETGITLSELGRNDEAVELFSYIDTTYGNTPYSGSARFRKAELYELKLKNFDSASVYYQKAVSGTAPKEIIEAGNSKIQKIKKYQTLRSDLNNENTQLTYILHPEKFVADSIAYFADSLENAEMRIAQEEFGKLVKADTTKRDTTKIDSLRADSLKADSLRADSLKNGLIKNNTTLTNNQNSTNNTNINKNNTTQGDNRNKPPVDRNNPRSKQPLNASLVQEDKKPPVRPVISADSVNSLLVKTKFELANLFFAEFNLSDSAYYYYTDIIENHKDSTYMGRALFGVASYYESIKDTSKSDSLYRYVFNNYKKEKVVNSAARKLKQPEIDLDFDPARAVYVEAEKLWLKKDYNESLTKFLTIPVDFPKSTYAPKAMYAGGWILENELKLYDSAAVVYDSVTARYPQSVYSTNVKPKITTYKTIRKAIADSLAKMEKARLDSLRNDSLRVKMNASLVHQDSLSSAHPDSLNHVDSTAIKPAGIKHDSTGAVPGKTPSANDHNTNANNRRLNNAVMKEDSLIQQNDAAADSLKKDLNKGAPADTLQTVPAKKDTLKPSDKDRRIKIE